jgi:DNA polymerase
MIPVPLPPKLADLRAGTILRAGLGTSTVIPDIDFETYSEAGFVWQPAINKWGCLPRASQGKKGLPVIGAARYAEHPSTEILSMAYDLKDGLGRRLWKPSDPAPMPDDLYFHVIAGGLLEAWNVGFERHIWEKICVPRLGWPPVARSQWRCAMAKARAFALPGALGNAADVLGTDAKKDKDGKRLLDKFSIPRNPTKNDPRTRIRCEEDPADAARLYSYNGTDIEAEAEVSSLVPDLEGEEFEYWQIDQEINCRGVQIDLKAVTDCIAIVEQALERYNTELYVLTGGTVSAASEIQKLTGWLGALGVHVDSLDEEHLDEALKRTDLPPQARRALEIRALVGSASVKKIFAMANTVCSDGRVRDLFTYHGARTGRVIAGSVQPTNLPNHGPEVFECPACSRHYGTHLQNCPWCAQPSFPSKPIEWGGTNVKGGEHGRSVDYALEAMSARSLDCAELMFGDALPTISGCLRGLFVAAPGHDLICSDYSAIEAVVLAELAGESWRQEVFRTHGKIYEMSAAKQSGIPLEEILEYKERTGSPHPLRKRFKVFELALGYAGWIGALKAFGADDFMTEDEMRTAILDWRKASPALVEFWGGQSRNWRPELFGQEGAAVSAVMSPGTWFQSHGFYWVMQAGTLYCRLLSGRYLTYHRARLSPSDRRPGEQALSYEGWNSNPKNGPMGWITHSLYAGKITENLVQATARDIQRYAIINQERAGYPIVLHVYDENVAEVPEGFGSIEEFERIMSTMPPWAAGWPVRATGGYRAKRYKKG